VTAQRRLDTETHDARESQLTFMRHRLLPFLPRLTGSSRARAARSVLLAMVLLGATAWYGNFLDRVRPLDEWLFFDLAKIWGWELLLTAACASFGHLLLVRVLRMGHLPGLEKLSLSLALGLAAFAVGLYLGGFAHLLRPAFGVGLPLVMLAAGAREAWRARHELSYPAFVTTPAAVVATAFGTLCVGILYLGVFSPESLNYDAKWNHLVIAQDYARAGRIVPFPGDWVKNVPHLGSVVNTWAFLVPGFKEPPQRWMMALHDEFTVFLWTLVGVAAAARYLSERTGLRGSWAAFFLFPSIFIHDGNMGCAADHFAAAFAVPVFLAAARLVDELDWRHGALLGALAGAAMITKYQVVYLLIPITLVLGGKMLWLYTKHLRRSGDVPPFRQVALAVLAAAGAMLAIASLHFGSSWAFFHNPFFPLAQGLFHSRPYLPGAKLQMDFLFADYRWHPPKVLSERLLTAAKMVATFSFKPHYTFTGDMPTFGSLLTLLFPALFLVGRARKLWLGMGVCLGGLFVWAMTYWVDRNLQMLLPLMAAVVGALIARIWEVGALARAGLTSLVGLQLVWGGDWYFSGTDRIANAFTLIRSELDGKAKTRFDGSRRDFLAMGKALPEDAVVLLHDQHEMLGIDRPVLLDWVGFQGVIDYRNLRTPRDVYDRFHALGVTHVVWNPGSRAAAYRQEEVVFDLFAHSLFKTSESFGGMRLSSLPKHPPKQEPELSVVVWKVGRYENGLYPVSRLNICEEMPADMQHFPNPEHPLLPAQVEDALRHADAALIGDLTELGSEATEVLGSQFFAAQRTGALTVYGRNPGG